MLGLRGRRILVVEDEWLLADELDRELGDAGATVVGPVPSTSEALGLLAAEAVDGAILDINLGSETALPVADELARRGIPFVFSTGYGEDQPPLRHAGAPLCQKPLDLEKVARALAR